MRIDIERNGRKVGVDLTDDAPMESIQLGVEVILRSLDGMDRATRKDVVKQAYEMIKEAEQRKSTAD